MLLPGKGLSRTLNAWSWDLLSNLLVMGLSLNFHVFPISSYSSSYTQFPHTPRCAFSIAMLTGKASCTQQFLTQTPLLNFKIHCPYLNSIDENKVYLPLCSFFECRQLEDNLSFSFSLSLFFSFLVKTHNYINKCV